PPVSAAPATSPVSTRPEAVPKLAQLELDLRSRDPERQRIALAALTEHAEASAVSALADALHAGLPDALADRAIQALGGTRSSKALSTLAELTRHRRAGARAAAYAAASGIEGEAADELIALGLRDSDANVRGLCARSLGERGARTQLDLLFRALERGVPEASPAIGKLAPAAGLERFHAQLGHAPMQVMLAGYEQILRRADLDEAVKLDVIARLGEVAGLSAKRFLERMLVDRDWSKQARVQRALADTAKRIDARPPQKAEPKP
ncbi:MAG: HEAT repeat domain-containing protein, partial [Polyangiales bacterium]